MMNIIKSQLYSIRHDIYTYICLFASAIIFLTSTLSTLGEMNETMTGSLAVVSLVSSSSISVLIMIMMFATRLSGWDFNDKTINFEALYGHKRSSIYWSRVIVAMVFCLLISAIVGLTPVIVSSLINGWGYSIPVKEGVLRCALMFLPVIRMISLLIFFSVLLRNSWAGLLIGVTLYIVESAVTLFWETAGFVLTASNFIDIVTIENYRPDFINGEDVIVFTDRLSTGYVCGTIAVSIIVAAVCLIGGYVIFRKRDIN